MKHPFAIASAAAALTACAQLLDIEEARVDPSLSESKAGRSGASAGKGGESGGGGGDAGDGSSAGGVVDAAGASGTGAGEPAAPTAGQSGGGGQAELGGGQGGEAGSAPSLCAQYCEELERWCTGELVQYADTRQCLAVCALLEPGAVGDENVNTVGCRIKYAFNSRYEAETACRRAGPGGDGSCGTNCEGLCSVMAGACTEETASPYYYEDADACLSDCEPLSEVPYTHGAENVLSGNTVQCRIYHATTAVMFDAEEHCGHALGFYPCADGP